MAETTDEKTLIDLILDTSAPGLHASLTKKSGTPIYSKIRENILHLLRNEDGRLGIQSDEIVRLLSGSGMSNPQQAANALNQRVQTHDQYWKNQAGPRVLAAHQAQAGGATKPLTGTPSDVDTAEFVRKVANTLRAQAPNLKGKVDYEAWAAQLISQNRVLRDGSITGGGILDDIDISTIATSGAAGAGGGGFAPQQTTYSFANYPVAGRGNVLFKIASDGSDPVEVPGITLQNPLTDIAVEETTGDLLGYNPVTKQKELIKKGYSFPKSDPNVKIILDKTTGKTISQNMVTGEKRELGTYDFPEISPQEAAAEAATIARLGPAASMRGQDISAYTTDRGQSINERLNQRTAGLNEFNTVKGILNSPSDYLARAFLSQGKASPGGNITQADLINSLRAEMGPFKQVSPALDLSQFNPETYRRMAEALAPRQVTPAVTIPPVPATPLMPTGGSVSQADFDRMQAYTRNQPAPVNPVNPNQNTWTVGQTPTTQEQLLINMQNAGVPNFMIQQQLQSMGLMPSVPNPVTGTAPASAGSSPVTGAAPAAAGSENTYGSYGLGDSGAMPNFDAPATNTYGGYGLGDSGAMPNFDAPATNTYGGYGLGDPDAMAYGGATRDPRFIVGDRHDGRPTGTEEMIINPTRAPIQVIPNSRLAAYYGGTMPDRFADGTGNRLGMYPRYDKGTETDPTILEYLLDQLRVKYEQDGDRESYKRGTAEVQSQFTDEAVSEFQRNAMTPGSGYNFPNTVSTTDTAKEIGGLTGIAALILAAKSPRLRALLLKQAPKVNRFLESQGSRLGSYGQSVGTGLMETAGGYRQGAVEGIRSAGDEAVRGIQRVPGGFWNSAGDLKQNAAAYLADIQSGLPRNITNPETIARRVQDYIDIPGVAQAKQAEQFFTDRMRKSGLGIPTMFKPEGGFSPDRSIFEYPTDTFRTAASSALNAGSDALAELGELKDKLPAKAVRGLAEYLGLPGYAEGTGSRLGMYPRYADGVLPVVQGAPAGSLAPITQDEIVNMARQYSPPVVNAVLGQGEAIPRQLPVQSASMRQTNNLTSEDMSALGTRLAAEGTSMTDYNALQQGLFGNKRTSRRGRLVI